MTVLLRLAGRDFLFIVWGRPDVRHPARQRPRSESAAPQLRRDIRRGMSGARAFLNRLRGPARARGRSRSVMLASNLLAARSQMAFTLGLPHPARAVRPLPAAVRADRERLRAPPPRRGGAPAGAPLVAGDGRDLRRRRRDRHGARRSSWASCGRGCWGGSATCSGCRSRSKGSRSSSRRSSSRSTSSAGIA